MEVSILVRDTGTPTFLISGNSGLRHFPIFSYYVITLISCLHLSLVTPSTVVSTSLSPDLQFPLPYFIVFAYVTQIPFSVPGTTPFHSLVYKYLYSVPRSAELRLLLLFPFLVSLVLSLISSTHYSFLDPEIPESRIPTLSCTQKSGIPEGFHREQGNTLSLPR